MKFNDPKSQAERAVRAKERKETHRNARRWHPHRKPARKLRVISARPTDTRLDCRKVEMRRFEGELREEVLFHGLVDETEAKARALSEPGFFICIPGHLQPGERPNGLVT